MNLSGEVIKAYEDYILSEEPEQAFKQLTEGTDPYNYLKSISILKKYKNSDITQAEKKILEEYIKEGSYPKIMENRYKLLTYEKEKEKEGKKKIAKEIIGNLTGEEFKHSKPPHLKRDSSSGTDTEDSKAKENLNEKYTDLKYYIQKFRDGALKLTDFAPVYIYIYIYI